MLISDSRHNQLLAATTSGRVAITSSGRLHFGFADLGNTTGRQFGSIGLSLASPSQHIEFAHDHDAPVGRASATGPDGQRVVRYLETVLRELNLPIAVKANVVQALPAHSGLGSGTQLALACATAACALAGHTASMNELGAKLQRGARSGIGIAAFQHGGFIVDGGRYADTPVPPVTVRHSFPEDWPLVLVYDAQHQGLSAHDEKAAFSDLPAFPVTSSGEICRLILLQMLPALAEKDLAQFAAAISRIQAIIGEFFAPFQGGGLFSSPAVAAASELLMSHGALGAGQSSWGPTGYAFFHADGDAKAAVKAATKAINRSHPAHGLTFDITTANNEGAKIVPPQCQSLVQQ